MYVASACVWVETYLSKSLLQQQYRWVVAREMPQLSMPYVGLPLSLMVLPLWFPWTALHRRDLELPRQPVISIDSVSSGQWGQPDIMLPTTAYEADPSTARLRMCEGWDGFGSDHLSVLFTAGETTVNAIAKPVLNAVLLLTAFLYENRGDTGSEMPTAAAALLSPLGFTRFGGQ